MEKKKAVPSVVLIYLLFPFKQFCPSVFPKIVVLSQLKNEATVQLATSLIKLLLFSLLFYYQARKETFKLSVSCSPTVGAVLYISGMMVNINSTENHITQNIILLIITKSCIHGFKEFHYYLIFYLKLSCLQWSESISMVMEYLLKGKTQKSHS